ncbi:RHS repeat-associated core domain-containing protein [Treponema pedis]|uniref:endonuclease toxin domain-containing protein n=2 Tax=Treponema pedis TaxID=409322 RepID=UPI0020901010|nr:RHS repeat-associated core domain-containing protein [Treponema pedis]
MTFENRHVGCKEREKINRRRTLCTLRINFFEATPQTACIFSKDDEHAQRVYIRYGNGVETRYKYDEKRRWLDSIETENKQNQDVFQKIKYSFDPVGNVLGYTNEASTYETTQAYKYDNLYQLISVEGESKQYKGKKYFGMSPVNIAKYKQEFNFDIIGNMMNKMSTTNLSGSRGNAYKKADLDYNLDYEYDSKYAHRLIRAGNRYYRYDGNGNITAEKDGSFSEEEEFIFTYNYDKESGVYSTDYGFGLDAPKETEQTNPQDLFAYRRNYTWNERNLLTKSSDKNYTVHYRYGEDGQRALKYTEEGRSETLYFNNFFTIHIPIYDKDNPQGLRVHKHIFVGNSRLVTAMTHTDNHGDNDEQKEKRYYYHSDHLGSAQFVTDWKGRQYEHIEYTPYGELWIEEIAAGLDKLPFRFTGKELDEETGLYYYGARYLDPKYSRWLSGDPALGEYIPKAPIDDEAKKHNENLPNGGVYNAINLHVFNYGNNNPIKYNDPTGEIPFMAVTGIIGAGIGALYGVYKSYTETGSVDWNEVGKGALIGGAIGLGAGAAGAAYVTGSATASVTTVAATYTAPAAAGTSIWGLDKFARGWEAEQRLGEMMNNFPVIDKFKQGINGFASSITSIKSMDLACKTYQKGGAILSRLSSYIDKVANYTTERMGALTVSANSATQRILELAIPSGATPEQMQAIQQASEYAAQNGVELIVHVIE